MGRIRLLVGIVSVLVLFMGIPAWATIAPTPEYNVSSGTAAWGTNGRVWALVRLGNVVYIGGDFTMAIRTDGVTAPRSHLMAVNVNTGRLRAWRPSVNGIVFSEATDGQSLFVGGDFTAVDGLARDNFAALGTNGVVRDWHLDTTNQVRALTYSAPTLYLGGQFGFVEGQRRTRLAAVDLTSEPPVGGSPPLLDWRPKTDKSVRSIVVMQNGNVLVAGVFDAIQEQGSSTWDTTKPFIQALTPPGAGGGLFAQWDQHTIDFVWRAIVIPDGRIVVGRGGAKGGTVAVYTETGDVVWHHGANGDVQAVGYTNGQVIAGGHFTMIGGGPSGTTHIPRLVAFDPAGGALDTSWQPWPDSTKGVWSLLGRSDSLFVGGDFSTMDHGTVVSNHLAQFAVSP